MEFLHPCLLNKEKGFGADIFVDSKHKKLLVKTTRYSTK
jgi:hypothetical protein